MKPALEAPKSRFEETSIVAFVRMAPLFEWNWHYHPEIELTWIRHGRGTRLVGDHSAPYAPGDLVLLGANLPHTWFSEGDSPQRNEAIVIQFRARAFPEPLLELPEFVRVRSLLQQASRGIRFSAATAHRLGRSLERLPSTPGLDQWLGLSSILAGLASAGGTPLASPRYRHGRVYKLSSRLETVTRQIEQRCREEMTLPEAARLAGLTPSAFSRFFRKMTCQTFVDYRNSCRIRIACELLADSDLTITEIAHECGFNNLASFNRRFRREKQMVPRDYRRLHEANAGRAPAA